MCLTYGFEDCVDFLIYDCEDFLICDYVDCQICGYEDFLIYDCEDFLTFGYVDCQIYGYVDCQICGYEDFLTCGCEDFLIYGCVDFLICGCVDYQIYDCVDFLQRKPIQIEIDLNMFSYYIIVWKMFYMHFITCVDNEKKVIYQYAFGVFYKGTAMYISLAVFSQRFTEAKLAGKTANISDATVKPFKNRQNKGLIDKW